MREDATQAMVDEAVEREKSRVRDKNPVLSFDPRAAALRPGVKCRGA